MNWSWTGFPLTTASVYQAYCAHTKKSIKETKETNTKPYKSRTGFHLLTALYRRFTKYELRAKYESCNKIHLAIYKSRNKCPLLTALYNSLSSYTRQNFIKNCFELGFRCLRHRTVTVPCFHSNFLHTIDMLRMNSACGIV